MGLSVSLSNALSGMRSSQDSLDVLARNVANAGTPGYHRQSMSLLEGLGSSSSYSRTGGIERAFNQSLQTYYTRATSDAGYTHTRANVLDRLQTFLGKPGDAGSLDTMFSDFQNALQQLSASPDSYSTRSTAVAQAQAMAETLNSLTGAVQDLRRETEVKISSSVNALNQSLSSLARINQTLADQGGDPVARASLMDERDRLVAEVAQAVDVRVDYRDDGSVSLYTRSGVGLLDNNKASVFEFQSGGLLNAEQQYNVDPEKSGVGSLVVRTASGLALDAVGHNVLRSGELAALVELRDTTLVQMQDQLDEVAAALAQSLSTVKTEGTAVTAGAAQGLEVDLSAIRNGNDFVLNYTENGVDKSVRVMRVDDTTKLPLDYLDANGTRVIGLDFSGGAAAVAGALGTALGSGFAVSNPSGSVLRVLDDGATNATTVNALTVRSTATGLQNGDLGLNLFVDTGNADFTNALDGRGQKRGFAGRIQVNSAIVANNSLLVQYAAGGSLGDASRAEYLVDQINGMSFASGQGNSGQAGFRLGGTVSGMISQLMDRQGSVVASALNDEKVQEYTMEALTARISEEYGVDVDAEMARLMELQNAYAANARVISVVQELLDRLMQL